MRESDDNSTTRDELRPSSCPPRAKGMRKFLKAAAWTIGSLALLILVAVSAVVWFLHPDRLTPIIERVASDNLNADVEVGRAELTFWSTFPKVKIHIDDLRVVSRSLDTLDDSLRRQLPADADSLLAVAHFDGSVNLLKIIGGTISIGDVTIDRPRLNLLQVNDSTSNFAIVPPSPPDTASSPIPNIQINHFVITNALPFTYRSMADSIELAARLRTIDLADRGTPLYELEFATDINTPLLRDVSYEKTRLNLDASISWSGEDPYKVGVKDLIIKAEELDIVIDAEADFRDELRFDKLDFRVNKLDINALKSHLPPSMREKFSTLDTDMKIDVDARLTKPLVFSDSLGLPCVAAEINIEPCKVYFGNARFNHFSTSLRADFAGDSLNSTVVEISGLKLNGRSVDVDLKGRLSEIFTDPRFAGEFKGRVDFSRLPSIIKNQLKARVEGTLTADTRFAGRLSDLDRDRFHRVYVKGDIDLDNFRFVAADSSVVAYTRHGCLKFGSDEKIKDSQGGRADSLLVVNLTLDTANVAGDGHYIDLARFKAGVGSTNRASSSDTTAINPFGGGFSIDRLSYFSQNDSIRLRLRDAKGFAALRRYEGDKRVPQLDLALDARRFVVGQRDFRASLRRSKLNVAAHFRPRRRRGNALAPVDSLARVKRRPGRLTVDQLDSLGVEVVDFDVDNSLRNVLRRWDVKGALTAESGRVRVAGFALRNSFNDLAVDFTTDSVALDNVDLKIGQSDFKLAGSVSNIVRAMNPRRPGPIKMDLNVVSDTININQIVQAFTTTTATGSLLEGDDWDEHEADKLDSDLATDTVGRPLLIPVNLDAGFSIKAANVVYSDMLLEDFAGELLIFRGVAQLHNLTARNQLGRLDVSALYAAPTAEKMELGLGMNLTNFHVGRLSSMVPALDTIAPMINSLDGLVNARIAATTKIRPNMDIDLASLSAALKFEADSLVLLDDRTFRSIGKWLMFKHKDHNMIDSLTMEIVVGDNMVQLYPFVLNIDRYKLGIMGHNDLNFNLNYHISVLKSPIPFKFGINLKGTADSPKIRFGGAKFKDKMVAERTRIADDARVNLVEQINTVFRRGLRAARLGPLQIKNAPSTDAYLESEESAITRNDSLFMIQEGIIEAPDSLKAVADSLGAAGLLGRRVDLDSVK